ncbi:MAG: ABC transporter ATP-binding protein, partial [Thermoplasmataceae archaeon]
GFFGVFYPMLFAAKYLAGKRSVMISVIAAGVFASVTRLLIPVYIGDAVTAIESRSYAGVLHVSILIMIVSSITGALQFVVSYGSQYISQRFEFSLRDSVFHHLIRKKFSFFETETSGDLLSRTTMDIHAIRNFLNNLFSQMLPTIFLIIFALYFLLTINPYFALIFLVSVPMLIYAGIAFQKKQRSRWRRIRTYYGQMNERLQENIVGNRVVRGFSAEDLEIGRFSDTTESYYGEYIEVAKLRGFYNNLMPLIVSAAASAILIYGGYMDIISVSDVGPLVAAVNIFSMISSPVSSFGRLIVFSENARAGIERVSLLTDSPDEEDVDILNRERPEGDLRIEDITFYRDGRKILDSVSMVVPRGEFAAITGKTGAGKTTLTSLIPRFYDPDEGNIYIGMTEISRIPLANLRSTVSLVPQEINLLSGTIRENIAFGNDDVGNDDIRNAARTAEISDFIESLPDAYETQVGERGITLSGGQKQRVALARAIVSHPSLLILDDATSSVDPETELMIFRNIKKDLRDITVLLVTHRISALKFADRVWKLEDGKLLPVADINRDLEGITDGIGIRYTGVGHATDL